MAEQALEPVPINSLPTIGSDRGSTAVLLLGCVACLCRWLFVGSERAGHGAAVLTMLLASCKNNLVEPCAYLHDVLNWLAHKPSTEKLTQLLPAPVAD